MAVPDQLWREEPRAPVQHDWACVQPTVPRRSELNDATVDFDMYLSSTPRVNSEEGEESGEETSSEEEEEEEVEAPAEAEVSASNVEVC